MSVVAAAIRKLGAHRANPFVSLRNVFAGFWYELTRDSIHPYRPELHYMRGPGPRAETNLRATLPKKHKADRVVRSGRLILCVALFLVTSVATAFAQESEQKGKVSGVAGVVPKVNASTFDATTLPSLDTIDAQTDITVFLRSGVPAGLRVAALRRAWTADPAIGDFRGLQENDWNFNDPNGVPGFGELGPEVDTNKMVAQILGETSQVMARAPSRHGFDIALRFLQSLHITSSAVAHD